MSSGASSASWSACDRLAAGLAGAQHRTLVQFRRLRPLHTSAVIFAFGGNALIWRPFYVVQRTSRARLFGGDLAWFVFWGYQLFIVMAAPATCWASPRAANTPSRNGTSTCG
jgi:cbb3-type cytochrome oxidase subunit 1